MDVIKIQTDIIKGLHKGKIHGLLYCYIGDDIYVAPNGYVIYRIHRNDFYIDRSKYGRNDDLKKFVEIAKNGNKATSVTMFDKNDKGVKGGVGTGLALLDGYNSVYINYDLVKPFESKKTTLTFTITDATSAVGVWEDGTFVGVVLPFRYNKDGVNPMMNERNYYE